LNVEEKPTGNVMLGAGFSQSEKFMVSGSISQDNIFGSGKSMGVSVNTGKVNRTFSISYTDPYFTIDGISQGFDLYHRTVNPTSLSVGDYKTVSTGTGVRFGFPIGEKESINIGLGIDNTKITVYDVSPQRYIDFVNTYGSSNLTIPLTASWVSDAKDSNIMPTTGVYQRLGAEIGMPGGDLKYWKLNYQYQRFFALSRSFTFMLNGDFGYGNGYGNQEGLPFYKNYYVGGIGSVRGYSTASLGPRDAKYNDENLGGNRKIVGNAELLWGLPGYDKTLRMGWFFDMGNAFGPGEKVQTNALRASTGLSLAWVSPMGPLKFSIAAPLNKKSGDDTEAFQFQLGSTF